MEESSGFCPVKDPEETFPRVLVTSDSSHSIEIPSPFVLTPLLKYLHFQQEAKMLIQPKEIQNWSPRNAATIDCEFHII